MANIIELLYRDFIWPYKRILLIVFLLILFIIAGAYAYQWYAVPKINPPKYDDVANADRRQNTADLLFFYAQWCPHCKTAKPEWEQLVSEYDGKTINGRKVIFTDVNCTNESPDVDRMMDQYHIEGFPTIKLLKDGQVISYDAKPTKATLIQFLNTAV